MEHHEEMVRGMHLVRELERDLKIATVICMNGRRPLTSSMIEVSRDLIVTSNSKKKQVLLVPYCALRTRLTTATITLQPLQYVLLLLH